MIRVIFGNIGLTNMSGSNWYAIEIQDGLNKYYNYEEQKKYIPYSETTKKEFISKNGIIDIHRIKDGAYKGFYRGLIKDGNH